MAKISFVLNNDEVTVDVPPDMMLLQLLRERLGLTGTKEGCGKGDCGACTVLLDGVAVDSCLVPVQKVNGRRVLTVEGLEREGHLHPLQEAFIRNKAFQCGFCTPGMLMSALALLESNKNPSEAEIQEAISGNLCRCTGYKQIIEAVKEASQLLREKERGFQVEIEINKHDIVVGEPILKE